MTQRGRKSHDEQATKAPPKKASPPKAPSYLSKKQRELWNSIVASKPADWFTPDSLPILEAYVEHATSASAISKRIAQLEASGKCWNGSAAEYHKLLDLRLQETKAAEARARSLRLTHQARWQPASAARKASQAPVGTRPWEE